MKNDLLQGIFNPSSKPRKRRAGNQTTYSVRLASLGKMIKRCVVLTSVLGSCVKYRVRGKLTPYYKAINNIGLSPGFCKILTKYQNCPKTPSFTFSFKTLIKSIPLNWNYISTMCSLIKNVLTNAPFSLWSFRMNIKKRNPEEKRKS